MSVHLSVSHQKTDRHGSSHHERPSVCVTPKDRQTWLVTFMSVHLSVSHQKICISLHTHSIMLFVRANPSHNHPSSIHNVRVYIDPSQLQSQFSASSACLSAYTLILPSVCMHAFLVMSVLTYILVMSVLVMSVLTYLGHDHLCPGINLLPKSPHFPLIVYRAWLSARCAEEAWLIYVCVCAYACVCMYVCMSDVCIYAQSTAPRNTEEAWLIRVLYACVYVYMYASRHV